MSGRSGDVAGFWRDIDRAVKEGQKRAITKAAQLVHKEILEELDRGNPGKGRSYRVGRGRRRRRRVHKASRPGDAPATNTGNLRRAVAFEINDGDHPTATVGVKSTAAYGRFLDPETGQRAPRIGRRPFVSSAVQNTRREVGDTIRREVEAALRRVT